MPSDEYFKDLLGIPKRPVNPEEETRKMYVRGLIKKIRALLDHLLELDFAAEKEKERTGNRPSPSRPPITSHLSSSTGKALKNITPSERKGVEAVNPQILMECSPFLCKEGFYEAVMKNLTREAEKNDNQTALHSLKRVDSFLTGYIFNERKSRARLKINYLLSAAQSEDMETAIFRLSKTDEIDQFLFLYLSQLIHSEENKLKTFIKSNHFMQYFEQFDPRYGENVADKMTMTINNQKLNESEAFAEELAYNLLSEQFLDRTLKQANLFMDEFAQNVTLHEELAVAEFEKREHPMILIVKQINDFIARNKVLKILLIIERRLKVELRYRHFFEMRMLGKLINTRLPEKRKEYIQKEIKSLEKLQDFEQFVVNAIEFINKHGPIGREKEDSRDEIELAPERLQLLREILVDIQDITRELKTGYKDPRTIYESTSGDDDELTKSFRARGRGNFLPPSKYPPPPVVSDDDTSPGFE